MSSRSRFRSRHERAATLALVVFAAFLFAGCDSGADPVASPSPTASATSSPSTTTSSSATPTISAAYKPADASGPAQNVPVPVLPDVAKTETKEGLEAFTRYWFELLSYGYETGDTAGFLNLSEATCEYCRNLATGLNSNYQDDQWQVGGRIVIPVLNVNFNRGADLSYQVILQVQQSTITYYKSDGSEFRSPSKPSDTGVVLVAAFKDSQWHVNDLHPVR